MADKFRVGQKVRIVNSILIPQLNGTVCMIIEPRKMRENILSEKGFRYLLDVKNTSGINYQAKEEFLEPLYDGDEASSWSACAWKPHLIDNKLPEVWKEKS